LLCLAALVASGCAASKPSDSRFGTTQLKPSAVPVQLQLNAKAEPVVIVTIRANNAGYKIVSTRQTLGTPTTDIDKSRDVLLTAQNAAGRPLTVVSVFNPRIAHTAGSKRPATAVLNQATFTVVLPADTRTLAITVRSGPNEKMETALPVPQSDGQKPR
jgi:hypothetical protein